MRFAKDVAREVHSWTRPLQRVLCIFTFPFLQPQRNILNKSVTPEESKQSLCLRNCLALETSSSAAISTSIAYFIESIMPRHAPATFLTLPSEIRHMIWEAIANTPRNLAVECRLGRAIKYLGTHEIPWQETYHPQEQQQAYQFTCRQAPPVFSM